MIEVLTTKNKLKGYIDGTHYLDAKQKPYGSLEGNGIKNKRGNKVLVLLDTGAINFGFKEDFFLGGVCRNNKIYHFSVDRLKTINKNIKKGELPAETLTEFPELVLTQFRDAVLYQFSEDKTQILDGKKWLVLSLKGPPTESAQLGDRQLLGITTLFLDLDKFLLSRVVRLGPGIGWDSVLDFLSIFKDL